MFLHIRSLPHAHMHSHTHRQLPRRSNAGTALLVFKATSNQQLKTHLFTQWFLFFLIKKKAYLVYFSVKFLYIAAMLRFFFPLLLFCHLRYFDAETRQKCFFLKKSIKLNRIKWKAIQRKLNLLLWQISDFYQDFY